MTNTPEYDRMISGKLYNPREVESEKSSAKGRRLAQRINQTSILDRQKIIDMEKELLGSSGQHIYIMPPLYVDYGMNIHVGENFYANVGCSFMDVAPITIGQNVMLGPGCHLLTPSHPIDAHIRNHSGLEFGLPIMIEDDVWLGGNVTVNPGVTIGARSIIGSGSVVTKDIPSDVIAVCNPARVLRNITQDDTEFWQSQQDAYNKEHLDE